MGRMTRAKKTELAEKLHVDEDAILDLPSENGEVDLKTTTPQKSERAPLGEIAPNSGGSREEGSEVADMGRSTRGCKAGKKGAKAKKNNNNVTASTASTEETQEETPEAVVDEKEAASSPASEEAAEDLMVNDAQKLHMPVRESELPRSQSPVARLTRSQLAKIGESEQGRQEQGEEIESQSAKEEVISPTVMEPTTYFDATSTEGMLQTQHQYLQTALDAPTSPLPSAMPNVIASLRKDVPGMRSTSNKENVEPLEAMPLIRRSLTPRRASSYDALEQAVVQAATPPTTSRQPSNAAIQTDEPSVESIKLAEQPRSPTPSPKKVAESIGAMDALDDAAAKVIEEVSDVPNWPAKPQPAEKPVEKETVEKRKTSKPVPIVKGTKASQARISMALQERQGLSKSTATRPRPSVALDRSVGTNARPAASTQRVISGTKPPAAAREKKETVIPHSKPRPVSLSFPTPPPPPKSKKAPTTSTFQLPGAAVAAKLKAAREARAAAEESKKPSTATEEQRRPTFKARPAPTANGKAPSVRQTSTSKARESLLNGKPAPVTGMHKRGNSIATTRPSLGPKPFSKPSTAAPALKVERKRPSTALAGISTSSTTTSQAKGTTKGKEVFNRAALAKGAAEKEKKEKEDAARKARVAAAERGRAASREWAEKQKAKKLLGMKAFVSSADAVQVDAAVSQSAVGSIGETV